MLLKNYRYYIDEKKYRIKSEESYMEISGWCFLKDGGNPLFEIEINDTHRDFILQSIERKDVQKEHKKYHVPDKSGFCIRVDLEKDESIQSIHLYLKEEKNRHDILSLNDKDIEEIVSKSGSIDYNIDGMAIDKKKITIHGWAVSEEGAVQYRIQNEKDQEQKLKLELKSREDVYLSGLIEEHQKDCGFTIQFDYKETDCYQLQITDETTICEIPIEPSKLWAAQKQEAKKGFIKQAIRKISFKNLWKILRYILKYGFRGLKTYIVESVNSIQKPYSIWFREHQLPEEKLKEQREKNFPTEPKVSIIVPTYNTPDTFLREMIDSVIAQTYCNWELCIGDGSGGNQRLEQTVREYAKNDKRIKYNFLKENKGISGNTNAALELATGDYIGLLDHDDVLAPNALYEIAESLQEDEYDILYTDEDKVSADLKVHADPNFKPDFSMDLFRSHNYITHFFVVKAEIIKSIGGFRLEFDGSQDYDLMFRCIENAKTIKHIPKILYHWRIHGDSVAGDPASKMYAYDAGKRAIEEHLKRVGIKASVEHAGLWGMYHVIYETPGNPLVSILIPNKDHTEDLKRCITSIMEKSSYKNIEFIIIENNSEKEETFSFYNKMEQTYKNLQVVRWEKEFNYSLINNFGVQFATGDYLLFLNNDTEIITETAISEMLGCCMREEVGAVGAKLLYEDDTVQHAGVVIGFGGYAGHVFHGIDKDEYGFMVRARINCNYSAVTAACMMTKKDLFEKVGGFDERFKVACNDVDYCLKIRGLDKLIVYNAFSHWYHYESKSRGYEDTPEKAARFESEIEEFQKKWPDILEHGDPFYNKNFLVTAPPFTLM